MNFSLIVMMLPNELTTLLSANLHRVADALAEKDMEEMQAAGGDMVDAVIKHVESLGITPEQVTIWLERVGIDPAFLTIERKDH